MLINVQLLIEMKNIEIYYYRTVNINYLPNNSNVIYQNMIKHFLQSDEISYLFQLALGNKQILTFLVITSVSTSLIALLYPLAIVIISIARNNRSKLI
jgi:hypothetical protein